MQATLTEARRSQRRTGSSSRSWTACGRSSFVDGRQGEAVLAARPRRDEAVPDRRRGARAADGAADGPRRRDRGAGREGRAVVRADPAAAQPARARRTSSEVESADPGLLTTCSTCSTATATTCAARRSRDRKTLLRQLLAAERHDPAARPLRGGRRGGVRGAVEASASKGVIAKQRDSRLRVGQALESLAQDQGHARRTSSSSAATGRRGRALGHVRLAAARAVRRGRQARLRRQRRQRLRRPDAASS